MLVVPILLLLTVIIILIVAAIRAPSRDDQVLAYLKHKYGRMWNTLDDAINTKPTRRSVLAEVSKATGRRFSSMEDLRVALAPDVAAVNCHFKGNRCDTSDTTLEICLDKYRNEGTELILLVEDRFGVVVDSVDDIPAALEARFSMDLVQWARDYLPTAALSITTRGDIPAAITRRFNELTAWADAQFGVQHRTVAAVVGSMDAYVQKPYVWARARDFDIGASPRIETVLGAVGVRLDSDDGVRRRMYEAVDALKDQLVLLGSSDPTPGASLTDLVATLRAHIGTLVGDDETMRRLEAELKAQLALLGASNQHPDASLAELIEALRAQIAAMGVSDGTESVTAYIQRLAAENVRVIDALKALLGANGLGPDASLTELIIQIATMVSDNVNKLVEMGVTISTLKSQLALGDDNAVIIAELRAQLVLLGAEELGVNASLAELVEALRAQVVAMGVGDDTESVTVYLQRLAAENAHTIDALKAQLVLLGVRNPDPDISLAELVEALRAQIAATGDDEAVISELRAQLMLLGVRSSDPDASLAVLVEALRAQIVAMGVGDGTESVTAYIKALEDENARTIEAFIAQLTLLGVGGLKVKASLTELIAAMDANQTVVVDVLRTQLALLGAGGMGADASLVELVEALRSQLADVGIANGTETLTEYIQRLEAQVADVADLARLIGAGSGASLANTKATLIAHLEGGDSLGEYLDSLRKSELEAIAAMKSHLHLDDDTSFGDLMTHLDKWMADKGSADDLMHQLLVDNRYMDLVQSQLARLFVGGTVAHLEPLVDAVVALVGRCDSPESFITELNAIKSRDRRRDPAYH
jgi:DNA-binding transcriptional ArsR family regulator